MAFEGRTYTFSIDGFYISFCEFNSKDERREKMNPSQRLSIFSAQSSFAILLLPLISGVFSYSYLPDRVATLTNWDKADNYLPKLAFLIGLPVAGLLFQLYKVMRCKKKDPTMNVFGWNETALIIWYSRFSLTSPIFLQFL